MALRKRANGEINGFVIEMPTAGGIMRRRVLKLITMMVSQSMARKMKSILVSLPSLAFLSG